MLRPAGGGTAGLNNNASPEPSSRGRNAFGNPFVSLRHRDFRYYFLGMCVSTIGTWMQNTAQPWLAYSLTRSPFLLSLVSALQFTPVLLFSLFAGVIIDRLPKKKILIVTQSASMVITLVLALLVFSGNIRYWHLLVTSTLLGVVNTLDMPSRQSFVVEMVGHDDLMNAIALNSMTFNVARIIGPSVAGIIIGAFGTAACFLFNSISFAAVLISLFFIHPVAARPLSSMKDRKIIKNIKDGLVYIRKNDIVLVSIIITAVVGTFVPNFGVNIPVFATQVLHQQATGYGFLMSIMGMGSLCGALLIAALSRTGPKRFILIMVPVITAVFLMLTGFTNEYFLTGLMLAVTGFFFVSFNSNANSTVQLNTDDGYRGRVMSVYTLVNAGSTPIGNLFNGAMNDAFGARMGFISSGIVVLVLMVPVYIFLMKKYRSGAL
jgi:MFS family permease